MRVRYSKPGCPQQRLVGGLQHQGLQGVKETSTAHRRTTTSCIDMACLSINVAPVSRIVGIASIDNRRFPLCGIPIPFVRRRLVPHLMWYITVCIGCEFLRTSVLILLSKEYVPYLPCLRMSLHRIFGSVRCQITCYSRLCFLFGDGMTMYFL